MRVEYDLAPYRVTSSDNGDTVTVRCEPAEATEWHVYRRVAPTDDWELVAEFPAEMPRPAAMHTYRMLVQQYVEQIAVVEVEAESEEAAAAMIGATVIGIECGDMAPAWEEGEDVIDVAVYAIQTADGEEFWTR